jgi:hypothetical protein
MAAGKVVYDYADGDNDDDDVCACDDSAHVNAMCRLKPMFFLKLSAPPRSHYCWISMRQIFGSQPLTFASVVWE